MSFSGSHHGCDYVLDFDCWRVHQDADSQSEPTERHDIESFSDALSTMWSSGIASGMEVAMIIVLRQLPRK